MDIKYEIHKVKRGFKIARQLSSVEWEGYLSRGLQYKKGVKSVFSATLDKLDTHTYATDAYCKTVLNNPKGI